MKIDIVSFDAKNAPKAEWARYHDYYRKRWSETQPDDPLIASETLEKILIQAQDQFHFHHYIVLKMEKPEIQIGRIMISWLKEDDPSYQENAHVCTVRRLELLRPYRQQGIGRQMLVKVCEVAKKHKKSLIVGGGHSGEADGKVFILAIGAQEANISIENRLSLEQVDWQMVEKWAKEGPDRSPEAEITFFSTVPEEIIEPFCEVVTETQNQAPRGTLGVGDYILTPAKRRKAERELEKQNVVSRTAITWEGDGAISGLTEVVYYPSMTTLITQGLTGVQEQYRGAGKGKWLKAAMLLKIRKKFPQVKVVRTGNATTNEPMLYINEKLGFKLYREEISAQITTEELERYLIKQKR